MNNRNRSVKVLSKRSFSTDFSCLFVIVVVVVVVGGGGGGGGGGV